MMNASPKTTKEKVPQAISWIQLSNKKASQWIVQQILAKLSKNSGCPTYLIQALSKKQSILPPL